MDFEKDNGDTCDEDSGSSGDEVEVKFSQQDHPSSRFRREGSPPLLLAFTSGRALQGSIPSPAPNVNLEEEEEEDEEDSDQDIEEWMILGRDEQSGDSSIQLNLSYWSGDEDDSGDEDEDVKDDWLVSDKDKFGSTQSRPIRYFGFSLMCNICNKTGHLARSCHYQKQKCPVCILCGTQGHIQRDCPGRPCPSCGLPSHGFTRCLRPPTWNQRCQRCGTAGHLSDACPDIWRQYHLTIRLEVPLRQHAVHSLKHESRAHCYNCSERGHYGSECTKKRMIGGTSPSLPYVIHYDTSEDVLQCGGYRTQKTAKEVMSSGSPTNQRYSEPRGEESLTVQGRSRTRQETWSRADRRKTWPEKRRERREVKRLRREAQSRREGGVLGRSRGNYEDEVDSTGTVRSPLHRQCAVPPWMKKGDGEGSRMTRKRRETEQFKKRRGLKRDCHPTGYTSSLEQRVRHRRR
ncbi:zinc finger CCHC domain-containing protein 7-like [Brachionichthys hirsutus]|uniref:zinc finger CCHC domain-containing protein 7-like n=1 Tax=Brachionichthys hirsutus TaxID=412623 RepID=UPI003604A804